MTVQIVVQGTIKPDGTLELDQTVPMPAGRVLVTVQPAIQPAQDDPFWQRMQAIWNDQQGRRELSRRVETVAAELEGSRDETEDEIQEAMRLQQECRQARQQAEKAQQKGP
jgi:hypothetical protein